MMKQKECRVLRWILSLMIGCFFTVQAMAQDIDVKGRVTDATGEAVIGAAVKVLRTNKGVQTDYDGNFTLKAKKGEKIQISYVGYHTTTVSAGANVLVTLEEDAKMLDNVVIIGYGRAKKNDLTGSVTAIKPDDKNHGLQVNAQDMIQGKIAGVNVVSDDGTPGGGATIRIRGGSSLNASNDPLIVIDGITMDTYGVKGLSNPLSMVNPNDIESFTVLKDASATAIYGSRASNGVIIITTKKGRSGQAPQVSYNGNVSIAAKKKTIDVMDGPAYTQFIKNMYGEGSDAYKALGWTDNSGQQHFANTDWQNEIYRTAVSTDHNITVTGGLQNMPYRVSLGYTNNQGIVKTSKFERYTGSFNLSPSFLNDHLKFNINGKGMIAKNRYADGGAIGAARYMDPTKPIKASNTIYNKYFGGYAQWYSFVAAKDRYDGAADWEYINNRNATTNPVSILDLINRRATSKTFVGNVEVDYAIHGFEDLHLHVNAAGDFSTGKQDEDIEPTLVSNNAYYYGYTGWSKQNTYNMQFSGYAQYLKDFAKVHHINVMAGYEYQHFHNSTDWDGYGVYPASNTSHAGEKYNAPTTETRYKSENFLVSFFGRLNYSLLDRYLLTFTMRADGSSRFKKHWGYFPSAAFAWKVNEEPFLRNVKWISDTKLRLGYGITGQQEGIADYYWLPLYTPNQEHAYYPIGLGNGETFKPDPYNEDLTWEKTTTWNAGVDFGFANNRIVLNVDWYYRKTKDLINTVFEKTGKNFQNKVTKNIGSLHNTGIEAGLTVRPIQNKNWTWEVNYNVTYNKNKIDELESANAETGGISAGTGGNIQVQTTGFSTNAFYVYQQVYDKSGKPIANTFVDRNGNGVLDAGDRYHYYKPAADVTMGFGSKLTWKNWDFSFSGRVSLGNYVYNDNQAGAINVGNGAIYTLGYAGNRTPQAVELGFTSPITEQYFSDYFVQNASFLKLDNITLGYSFDGLFKGQSYKGISGRVYATVQNVFTITKYDGIDPEVNDGIDNSIYPRPFTTVLGLSLNF